MPTAITLDEPLVDAIAAYRKASASVTEAADSLSTDTTEAALDAFDAARKAENQAARWLATLVDVRAPQEGK